MGHGGSPSNYLNDYKIVINADVENFQLRLLKSKWFKGGFGLECNYMGLEWSPLPLQGEHHDDQEQVNWFNKLCNNNCQDQVQA